jgi:isoquinoline 1-oxidoreductase alpha subunit
MEMRVNGQPRTVPQGWEDETLLQVLREPWGLVAAKYGCGSGQCGACTVLLDGTPVRSCVLPVAAAAGRAVTTLEGLAAGGLHPVQRAWLAEAVPQCGYCQSGQMLAAAALLAAVPRPTAGQVDAALAGHLCRCGTQHRVRAAVLRAAAEPRR